MPRPEDIQQFQRVLAEIAAAAGVAEGPARPGEPGPETAPSEQEQAAPEPVEPAGREAAVSETPPPGELPPDLGELLGDLGAEAPPPAGEEEAELDLGALLGEEGAPPAEGIGPATEAASPPAEAVGPSAQVTEGREAPGAGEGPITTEEEALLQGLGAESEEELPSLGADLDQLGLVPEDQEQAGLSIPDEFAAPSAGEGERFTEEAPTAAPGEEPGEAAGPWGPIEAGPAPSESAPGPSQAELAAPEIGPAPSQAGIAAPEIGPAPEEFQLGDLGELSLGEAPAREEAGPAGAPSVAETAQARETAREPGLPGMPATAEEAAPAEPGPPAAPEVPQPLGEELAELPDIGGLDELSLPGAAEEAPAPEAPAPEAPTRGPERAARPAAAPPRRQAPIPFRRVAEKARPGRAAGLPRGKAVAREPAAGRADQEALTAELGEIQLSDQQFDRLRKTLGTLPRNLKIIVQDLIAEGRASGADLRELIRFLVDGASPHEIATLAGRLLGKRIRLPAAFEKRTGIAFEAERRTFAFAFRENILPLARLFALTVIGAALAGFLGYRFVWQPLSANSTYRRGYGELRAERYSLANQSFESATRAWPLRGWYYRYAEGFADKLQFDLAAQKYSQLLARWPAERRAVLEWSRMESALRANYQEADRILKTWLLDGHPWDYEGLLAQGDNYLEWAGEDTAHFEDARLSWTKLMQRFGEPDAVLYRMLRLFVRTDNLQEAERLRALFFDRGRIRLDKVGAESFAELGGYLVGKREFDWARDVLLLAVKADPQLPEAHFELARFYRAMERPNEERDALQEASRLLEAQAQVPASLGPRKATLQVDARTRYGEVLYGEERYLDAARELAAATELVRRYEKLGVLASGYQAPGGALGRPFARLADVSYFIEDDLAKARDGYLQAIARGYTGPEIDYKLGYIAYARSDWVAACDSFLQAEDGLAAAQFAPPDERGVQMIPPGQVPTNLLFALGNSFYERGDWSAAEGTWRRLLGLLTARRQTIRTFQPLVRPEHRALLEALVKTNNNLGVAVQKLSRRTGDRTMQSQALVFLADAAEGADTMGRDPQTLVPGEAKSLPSLNIRGILYPVSGFELQIYRTIPKDLLGSTF